jgi:hypothetical protein
MDQTQARVQLDGERARLQRLLAETDEPQAAELGDEVEDADRRNADQTSTAIDQLLRARWVALQRAEARLAAGKSKLRLLTWTLLCCVKCWLGLEESVELADDVSDQAAFDLAVGLALGAPSGGVGAGGWVGS